MRKNVKGCILMAKDILMVAVTPHPPIVIESVGKTNIRKVSKTVAALQEISHQVAKLVPDTVIVISPHGPVFRDAVAVFDGKSIQGDLRSFNAPQEKMEVDIDRPLITLLEDEVKSKGLNLRRINQQEACSYKIDYQLDHGALVPMLFLQEAGVKAKYINITYGLYPYLDLYILGTAIKETVKKAEKKAVIIASGDLSHCLTPSAPGGYSPAGKVFDETLVKILQEGKIKELFTIEKELLEKAGECGFRSIIMALGSLDGCSLASNILSYEAPFGVGYLTATFSSLEISSSTSTLSELQREKKEKIKREREKESFPVAVARQTLELYLRKKQLPPLPDDISPEFKQAAGVFVSLKKQGQLRGCIGTTEPTTANITREIMQNVISAATEDPRFPSVEENELEEISYSVDVLLPPEPVKGIKDLNHKEYGVIVEGRGRRGLLLPDLPGVDTVAEQVRIACEKAGLSPAEKLRYYRFRVKRYS